MSVRGTVSETLQFIWFSVLGCQWYSAFVQFCYDS